jgi:hypothetical protein
MEGDDIQEPKKKRQAASEAKPEPFSNLYRNKREREKAVKQEAKKAEKAAAAK